MVEQKGKLVLTNNASAISLIISQYLIVLNKKSVQILLEVISMSTYLKNQKRK